MAENPNQNYANHGRLIPAYHYVAFGILTINSFFWLWSSIFRFSPAAIMQFLVSIALLIIFLYARLFPLMVQDRLIRLEMQMRMEKLFPADLKARIGDFSVGQMVALRFAPDEELVELCRAVLRDNITKRDDIKKMIKTWKPDLYRA